MRKLVTAITIVSATALLAFYIIGAFSNTDKVHDMHQGLEDRAIMQAENTVYTDAEFVKDADKAAGLICKTIHAGREYCIDFEIIASDGECVVEEQYRLAWDSGNNWRDYCKDAILTDLMRSEKVSQIYSSGKSARIFCTILMCPVYNDDGTGQCVLECSDFDNDGTWDTKSVSC